MTLEFGEAIKVLDEHIEILKQDLLFLMAERKKPERSVTITKEIITIKKELDNAVQERMKLCQIYCNSNNNIPAIPASASGHSRS